MKIQNRIVEYKVVPSAELRPHPKNWQTHPESQVNALKNILASVGIAGAALAFMPDDKKGLMLIDGHARVDVLDEVPILILDVNDEEAEKILLSYDSVGKMATVDNDKLDALLANAPDLQEDLGGFLSAMVSRKDWQDPAEDAPEYDAEKETVLIKMIVKAADGAPIVAGINELLGALGLDYKVDSFQ